MNYYDFMNINEHKIMLFRTKMKGIFSTIITKTTFFRPYFCIFHNNSSKNLRKWESEEWLSTGSGWVRQRQLSFYFFDQEITDVLVGIEGLFDFWDTDAYGIISKSEKYGYFWICQTYHRQATIIYIFLS